MASTSATYDISQITRLWRGGTEKVTLTVREMTPWYCCCICLHKAVEPYCCPNGDVFCKECALEFILNHTERNHQEKQQVEESVQNIALFMKAQRIAEKIETNPEPNQTSQVPLTHHKVKKEKCKCPNCKKELKWKKMHSCIYSSNSDGPLCCGCGKLMIGDVKAYRLPCNHVVCDGCQTAIVETVHSCPKCTVPIKDMNDVILLGKTLLDQITTSGHVVVEKKGMVAPYY